MANASEPVNITSLTLAGCIELQFGEYIPWNNTENIVSFETEELMYALTTVAFLPVFFLIGCPANIINMVVFYRQGLRERINVCLFALSLADEVYAINNMLWYGDQIYIRFTTKERYGPVIRFLAEWHLLGLHGFIWISQVISAIIASERCFCVLYPLRSQTMLQTSTMIIIIISVYVFILGLVSFELLRYGIACVVDPFTHSTTVTLVSNELYFRYQKLFDYLDIFVLGTGIPGVVTIVILTTTIVTLIKLRQAALWRARTSSHSNVSDRDTALTKMLVINSVFFIVCIIPFILFRMVFLFMPEVNAGGRKHNFYIMAQEILLIFSTINASFNFVVYYTMGSRYRAIFWQLVEGIVKGKNKSNMNNA